MSAITSFMHKVGPHSRPSKIAVVDGRSAEGRRLRAIKAELAAHLGGNPSATQKMMIDRAAMLLLRVELMDRRALKNGDMTERDTLSYLAWANTVTRLLRHLGLEGKTKPPSLADYLTAKSTSTPPANAA